MSSQRLRRTSATAAGSRKRRASPLQTLRLAHEALRVRLYEAEDTLSALRAGEVDAIVVSDQEGERVFTLNGEEHAYRVLVESMNEGALTLLRDGTIVYCNAHFADLVHAPLAQTIGRPLHEFIAPQDHGRFANLLAEAEAGSSKGILALQQPEGGAIPAQISLRSFFGESLDGLCAVVTDLTDRLRAEEALTASLREKELLLQEIHHRVKNNLQVIVSLLRIQAATMGDIRLFDVLQDTENRIRAMALMHEQLYRASDLLRISAASYLAQTTQMVQTAMGWGGSGWRLSHSVDPAVLLDPDAAIPLGLIVTELVANCIKHAFVGRSRGEIRVALRQDGPLIELTVADDGVGISAVRDPIYGSNLGLQLVASLVMQLAGTLSYGEGPGTVVIIVFPVRGT